MFNAAMGIRYNAIIMNLILPTREEIVEFFRHHHGYISVIDIATALIVPQVQRSTPVDEEWGHVRTLLHELKSGGFLLVQGEGRDIYNEKFSTTPDRIQQYDRLKKSTFDPPSDEILRSLREFLNDTRFTQRMRKIQTIRDHFPGLKESVLKASLSKIGAIRYLGKDNTELWSLRPHPNYRGSDESSEGVQRKDQINNPVHVSGGLVIGDKVGGDKRMNGNYESTKQWWQKPEMIIGAVTIIIALISIPWWPAWYSQFSPPKVSVAPEATSHEYAIQPISTTTMSLVAILDKNYTYGSEAERQDFREKYLNEEVYGEGTFVDRSKDQGYSNMQFLYMNLGRYPVVCKIENPSEELLNKLALLAPGNKVWFTGFFTGSGMAFAVVEGSWVLNNCTLYL